MNKPNKSTDWLIDNPYKQWNIDDFSASILSKRPKGRAITEENEDEEKAGTHKKQIWRNQTNRDRVQA